MGEIPLKARSGPPIFVNCMPTGMCISSNSLPTEVPTVELVTTHEKFETLAGDHCADLATYVAKYFCTCEKRFSMFCP